MSHTHCNYFIIITNSKDFCIKVRIDHYEHLFSFCMGKWQLSNLVYHLNFYISKVYTPVQETFMAWNVLQANVEIVKNFMAWDLILALTDLIFSWNNICNQKNWYSFFKFLQELIFKNSDIYILEHSAYLKGKNFCGRKFCEFCGFSWNPLNWFTIKFNNFSDPSNSISTKNHWLPTKLISR